VQSLSEAAAITEKAGVDLKQLAEAIEYNAVGPVVSDMKLPAIIKGDFEPKFSLTNMLKDSRLCAAIAEIFKSNSVTKPVESDFSASRRKGLGCKRLRIISEWVRAVGDADSGVGCRCANRRRATKRSEARRLRRPKRPRSIERLLVILSRQYTGEHIFRLDSRVHW